MTHQPSTPVWTWLLPLLGVGFFAATTTLGFDHNFADSALGIGMAVTLVPLLIAAVFAAVYHAEEIAHRAGEPYGTLVLTLAVTVIELSLIISLMIGGKSNPGLVRDTVYAVIMIITTGLVGACILMGGLRYREQTFDVTSANIYLATLTVLASLTLILPNYTSSVPGPVYSGSQLAFVSLATVMLYGVFLYTQTIRHKDYFLGQRNAASDGTQSGGVASHANRGYVRAIALLCLALIAVVLLAKVFALVVATAVVATGSPPGVTGVIIALLVLTPEGISAIHAARRDDLQKSLNLALGSSLATIGLTIPAMALAAGVLNKQLELGLNTRDMVLLITTLGTSYLTLSTGRTNVLFGFLHIVLFGMYLFLTFVP